MSRWLKEGSNTLTGLVGHLMDGHFMFSEEELVRYVEFDVLHTNHSDGIIACVPLHELGYLSTVEFHQVLGTLVTGIPDVGWLVFAPQLTVKQGTTPRRAVRKAMVARIASGVLRMAKTPRHLFCHWSRSPVPS